jgi:hypothetical protein
MEIDLIKVLLSKDNWLIIVVFVIYLSYRVYIDFIKYRKANKTENSIQKQFFKTIDSIDNKLKIIYAQYGCELSKEAAVIIIKHFYLNYANSIADDIYEQQKRGISHAKIIKNIENSISILNNEQRQVLDLFMYRNKHLVTFTKGDIVDAEQIAEIINNYSDKNGMLRDEIQKLLSIEAGIIITRLN